MLRTAPLALVLTAATTLLAADRPLFPQPFLIEHAVTVVDPDGGSFTTEAVVDHYGGAWIVSVRPDGSRLIVDLARRELTEVRPEKGTWSVLGFDRMAELRRRLDVAEGAATATAAGTEAPAPRLAVRELPEEGTTAAKAGGRALRRLRVEEATEAGAPSAERWVEVWVDPGLPLTPAALEGLEAFERAVAGGAVGESGRPGAAGYVAVARHHDGGRMSVRTLRPARLGLAAEVVGTIEDAALRVERLDAFPAELLEVPEGLERAPHPLELMVAWAEQEAELRVRMGAAGE
jgi:hypothetical protein